MKNVLVMIMVLGSISANALTKKECEKVEKIAENTAYLVGFAFGKAMNKADLSKSDSKKIITIMQNADNGLDFMRESPKYQDLNKLLNDLNCK
jgi:hypothetical protein